MEFGRVGEIEGAVGKAFHVSGTLSVWASFGGHWRAASSKASNIFPFIFLFTFVSDILNAGLSRRIKTTGRG